MSCINGKLCQNWFDDDNKIHNDEYLQFTYTILKRENDYHQLYIMIIYNDLVYIFNKSKWKVNNLFAKKQVNWRKYIFLIKNNLWVFLESSTGGTFRYNCDVPLDHEPQQDLHSQSGISRLK